MNCHDIISPFLAGVFFVTSMVLLIRYSLDELNTVSTFEAAFVFAFYICGIVSSFAFLAHYFYEPIETFIFVGNLTFGLALFLSPIIFAYHCVHSSCFHIDTPLYILVLIFSSLFATFAVGFIAAFPYLLCRNRSPKVTAVQVEVKQIVLEQNATVQIFVAPASH
ncbi:MAG: hypothetical protein Harvfovirus27_5 [Harvfovirus sp.]|uniref:Uncharacterized protein n=1 Tax=Harvfovirus sp. TaxID=2487768 RepID=A0A3G5A266_9VIRU|nr:MAG: hypothetical protein Harvfovirus27_5 [Harvfovirus sp.]